MAAPSRTSLTTKSDPRELRCRGRLATTDNISSAGCTVDIDKGCFAYNHVLTAQLAILFDHKADDDWSVETIEDLEWPLSSIFVHSAFTCLRPWGSIGTDGAKGMVCRTEARPRLSFCDAPTNRHRD